MAGHGAPSGRQDPWATLPRSAPISRAAMWAERQRAETADPTPRTMHGPSDRTPSISVSPPGNCRRRASSTPTRACASPTPRPSALEPLAARRRDSFPRLVLSLWTALLLILFGIVHDPRKLFASPAIRNGTDACENPVVRLSRAETAGCLRLYGAGSSCLTVSPPAASNSFKCSTNSMFSLLRPRRIRRAWRSMSRRCFCGTAR